MPVVEESDRQCAEPLKADKTFLVPRIHTPRVQAGRWRGGGGDLEQEAGLQEADAGGEAQLHDGVGQRATRLLAHAVRGAQALPR